MLEVRRGSGKINDDKRTANTAFRMKCRKIMMKAAALSKVRFSFRINVSPDNAAPGRWIKSRK